MTNKYTHIRPSLTAEELAERVLQLATQLGLTAEGTLSEEEVGRLALDVRLSESFKRAGVNLSKTHMVEQWAVFNNERDAKRFAREAKAARSGYKTRVEQTDSTQWTAVLRNRLNLLPVTIARETAALRKLAALHNGDYDGFEATFYQKPGVDFSDAHGEPYTGDELARCGISKRPGFELHPDNA